MIISIPDESLLISEKNRAESLLFGRIRLPASSIISPGFTSFRFFSPPLPLRSKCNEMKMQLESRSHFSISIAHHARFNGACIHIYFSFRFERIALRTVKPTVFLSDARRILDFFFSLRYYVFFLFFFFLFGFCINLRKREGKNRCPPWLTKHTCFAYCERVHRGNRIHAAYLYCCTAQNRTHVLF